LYLQLATTAEAGQLGGGLTNAQIRNVSIVNSLGYLRTGIAEVSKQEEVIHVLF